MKGKAGKSLSRAQDPLGRRGGRQGAVAEGQETIAGPFSGLEVLDLRLEMRAEDRIHLPAFAGSSFRGLLGWCLQAAACECRPPCRECRRPETCAYSYLFETAVSHAPSWNHGSEEVPRPFVLEPPFGGRGLEPGSRFRLGLRLFGEATRFLPHFLYAVEEMGRRGLGQNEARFRLLSAASVGPDRRSRTFHEDGRTLEEPLPLDLAEWAEATTETHRVEVRFCTPARLVSRGRVVQVVEFHHLIRSLLRRLNLLRTVHGDGPLDVDFRALVQRAEEVRLEDERLEWFDWQRHSTRQGRPIDMGGVVGDAIYEGDLEEFLPLLLAGELLHVGKATTFGMGRIEVKTLPGG